MMKYFLISILCNIVFSNVLFSANQSKYFTSKYIKETMLNVATWQLQHPRHKLMSPNNGTFYNGLFETYLATNEHWLADSIIRMGNTNKWSIPQNFKFPDYRKIMQTYIDIYHVNGDSQMIKPSIKFAKKYLASKSEILEQKRIAFWLCDYLFMSPPIIIKLGKLLNNKELLSFNDSLWHQGYDSTFDKTENLFLCSYNTPEFKGFHGINKGQKEKNGKTIYWSRGNGWALAGIAQLLKELPANYPERKFYEDVFKRLSKSVIRFQHSDGLWRSSFMDPETYPNPESSSSGLITYALAYGINTGLLSRKEYEPVVQNAWIGLNTICLQPDNRIGWCEQGTASPTNNFKVDSYDLFGTGVFLLAGCEILKFN